LGKGLLTWSFLLDVSYGHHRTTVGYLSVRVRFTASGVVACIMAVLTACAHEPRVENGAYSKNAPPRFSISSDDVERIYFSRSGCLGPCISYIVNLNRDGCAELNAITYLPWRGKYVGFLRPAEFSELGNFIVAEGNNRQVWDRNSPPGRVLDAQTQTLILTLRNGTRLVYEYPRTLPMAVDGSYIVGKAIDGFVLSTIWWKNAKSAPYHGREVFPQGCEYLLK
jgi:hypothetical protein